MATVRSADLAAFDEGDGLRRLRMVLEDPRVVLDQIGILIVKESGRAFRFQKLGGVKWKPRRVPNWPALLADAQKGARTPPDRRFRSTPALMDTGLLAKSVAHRLIGKDMVEVGVGGVAKTYADVHQVGGTSLTVPITQAIQERLWEWIKGAKKSAKAAQKRAVKALGTTEEAARVAAASKAQTKATALDSIRWLLNKNLRGKRLKVKVPARPFVGLPPNLVREIERTLGVSVRVA